MKSPDKTRPTNGPGATERGPVDPDVLASLNELYAEEVEAGLRYLHLAATLKGLERLNLMQTEITDDGLKHLYKLGKLVDLDVTVTFISEAGARRLQKALPDCEIRW